MSDRVDAGRRPAGGLYDGSKRCGICCGNEINAGKWHVAEVSTAGGEVSYLETGLDNPGVMDVLPDGSELMVAVGRRPFSLWVLPASRHATTYSR